MFVFKKWSHAPLYCLLEHREPAAHIVRLLARPVERERLHVEPSMTAERDRVQQVLQVFACHPTCTHAVVVFQDDQALLAIIAIRQQEPMNDARTQIKEARVTDDRCDYRFIFGCALIAWDTREVNNLCKGGNEIVAIDRHVVGYHPTRIGVLSERGAMSGILAH